MDRFSFSSINPLPPDGPWTIVRLRDGFGAPQRFVAEGNSLAIEIELDAEGIPQCRGLNLRDTDGVGITTKTLRRVALVRLMREAVAQAARLYTPVEKDGKPVFRIVSTPPSEAASFYEGYVKEARRPRQGSPVTDERLQAVADLYRKAIEEGQPPTREIADSMHVGRSTAARWVAKARERGYLGPAIQGRAGEKDQDV
jgi:hypothetical protein